jgi:hypothetical protein
MAYTQFKFVDLEKQFGLRQARQKLFNTAEIADIAPSAWLLETLQLTSILPMRNEKPKSEFLVAPILAEITKIQRMKIQLFSGENLDGDKKAKLNGEVDYIIVRYPQAMELRDPIIAVAEAKKGDVEGGLGQCAAQMYGARLFNRKAQNDIEKIYGIVTSGFEWHFLVLDGQTVFIDDNTYTLGNLPQLLGILNWIVEQY